MIEIEIEFRPTSGGVMVSRESSGSAIVGSGEGDFVVVFADGTFHGSTFRRIQLGATGYQTALSTRVTPLRNTSAEDDYLSGQLEWSLIGFLDVTLDPGGLTPWIQVDVNRVGSIIKLDEKILYNTKKTITPDVNSTTNSEITAPGVLPRQYILHVLI